MAIKYFCFIYAITVAFFQAQIGEVHSVSPSLLPAIIKHPASDEILFQVKGSNSSDEVEDRPLVIECEADSKNISAITYEWTKNGKAFNYIDYSDPISMQEGKGTLVFSKPKDEDAGQYQCFAKNVYGVATSNSVFVRKATITEFPENEPRFALIYEGITLNFSCGYFSAGYPKPSLYWILENPDNEDIPGYGPVIFNLHQRNDSNTTVDPDGNLWFFNLNISAEFPATTEEGLNFLKCCAHNSFIKETYCDNGLNLSIVATDAQPKQKVKIEYATNSENAKALKGHSIDLWCIATGRPLPTITWKKDGKDVGNGVKIKNFGRTLTIDDVDVSDEGNYICEATNGIESKNHSIKLTVFSKPKLNSDPDADIYYEEENKFRLKCLAEGRPAPVITWTYNGKPVAGTKSNPNRHLSDEKYVNFINSTKYGNYGCNASNAYGYVYKEILLPWTVFYNDLMKLQEDPNEYFWKDASFKCSARYPAILWQENFILFRGHGLSDKVNLPSNAGNYTCQIRHPYKTVNKTIVVMKGPKFITKPEDKKAFAGDTVTFNCEILTEPDSEVEMQWQRGLNKLDYETETRFNDSKSVTKSSATANWAKVKSTLTITNVTNSDASLYYCVLKLQNVHENVSALLTVLDINTWNCDNKISNRLKNLQTILNSTNKVTARIYKPVTKTDIKELDATVVLRTLKTLNRFNDLEEKSNADSDFSNADSENYILTTANLVHDITLKTENNSTDSEWENVAETALNVLGNLLINENEWTQLDDSNRSDIFTEFLDVLDSTTLNLAEKVAKSESKTKAFFASKNKSTDDVIVHLGASTTKKFESGMDIYASDEVWPFESSISIQMHNSSEPQSINNTHINYAVTMVQRSYIENIVGNTLRSVDVNGSEVEDQSKKLNGKMISFNSSAKIDSPTVRIRFAHNVMAIHNPKKKFNRKLHDGEIAKAILGNSACAFWDTDAKIWSTTGCQAISSDKYTTTCECKHLTAFSVLTGFHEYSGKDWALQILTWILCPLSIVCLLLSMASFLLESQGRRSEKMKIDIHLFASLIFGNVFLLIGDKDNLHLSDITCTVLGILTHFAWLCAFGWMAVEGIHLYIQVVKVFPPTTGHLFKIYSIVGYGIPLLLVGITCAAGFTMEEDNIYVGEMFCWLQGRYIWTFMAPVVLVAVGNLCVLIKAITIANNRQKTSASKGAAIKSSDSDIERKHIKIVKLIKASVSLTFILGTAWLFGLFTLVDVQGHLIFSYIFTILNGSQGTLIFGFHFERIRKVMAEMGARTDSSTSKSTEKTDYGKSKSTAEENPKCMENKRFEE